MSEDCKPCNKCNIRFRTCALYPNGCAIIKAIAARDKWWVEQIEQRFGDGHARPLIQASPSQWEDFTESLEVK